MHTSLTDNLQATHAGQEAQAILGKCVHCGFCTATCPTYQLLGDELDGPRGRIYLIKQVLEGQPATLKTLNHLDRCLTCRSCETTCPSGVEYGRLVEIGRELVEQQVSRPFWQQLQRTALKTVLPRNWLFTPLLRSGQLFRPLLPQKIAASIPVRQQTAPRPAQIHERRMILLEGCVQPGLSPNINAATARVLDRLKVQLLTAPKAGCCGALRSHLNDHEGGMADARRNIDAWIPLLDAGASNLLITASGCGSMVKEYGHMLRHDQTYADKAARISAATLDVSEVVFAERAQLMARKPVSSAPVVFHVPCSLQHGLKITGKVEQIMTAVGITLQGCANSHLCCGSAGTYSILQPAISLQLRERKLQHLQAGGAEKIVSANIGCITHLQAGTDTPVQHWIELLDELIQP